MRPKSLAIRRCSPPMPKAGTPRRSEAAFGPPIPSQSSSFRARARGSAWRPQTGGEALGREDRGVLPPQERLSRSAGSGAHDARGVSLQAREARGKPQAASRQRNSRRWRLVGSACVSSKPTATPSWSPTQRRYLRRWTGSRERNAAGSTGCCSWRSGPIRRDTRSAGRFVIEGRGADVVQDAVRAVGFAGFARSAAVQDQEVREDGPVFLGDQFHEVLFYFYGILLLR